MRTRPIRKTNLGWRWRTWRLFKRDKRAELRRVICEFKKFQAGCAYIPPHAYLRFERIRSDLNELQRELSANKWGR